MKPRLRVAMLTPRYYGEYAVRLALGLTPKCDVLLLSDAGLHQSCDQRGLDTTPLVAIKTFPSDTRWQRVAYVAVTLARLFWFRPHIVHCQEYPEWPDFWVVCVASLFFPIVLTVHDPLPHAGRDSEYARSRATTIRKLRLRARAVFVNGVHCRDTFAVLPGMEEMPIVTTRHGVLLVPAPEQRRQPRPRSILFFGRMEEYKGIEILLDAMEQLAASGIEFSLVFAGRGPELQRLGARIAALPMISVEERFLSPDDAIAEFQSASVVVLPYLDATQSGVAAAAFANGRPVVATQVGGLSEIVVDGVNGLLIEPGSSAALADALTRLLSSDMEWQRLADGATATARGPLNWSQIAEEMAGAYQLLLSDSREIRT
ncbi:MAG TPA: glycosyltransferase family 4 protein [Gemmatimonadaceae bacterium]